MFEDNFSILVFVLYIVLSVSQGLLVTATKTDDGYSFNFTTVVLVMEFCKLLVSLITYLSRNSFEKLQKEIRKNIESALLFIIPAALYCLYNNLQFINLTNFDPTTYHILLQSRIIVTGFIYQIFFAVNLNLKQWISLVILTIGCSIKQLDQLGTNQSSNFFSLVYVVILILTQVTCSSLASVYIEVLIKSKKDKVDIWLQNIFMYTASILCNVILLWLTGTLLDVFSKDNIISICQIPVLMVIINWVSLGLTTSLFLQKLNSIVKTFASGLDLVFIACLSKYFFSVPVTFFTIVSIVMVILAFWIYSKDPIRRIKVVPPENQIKATKNTFF